MQYSSFERKMKYARIDIETIGFYSPTEKAHINYGDHLQNVIIKDFYKKLNVSEDELYVLDFNDVSTYKGEKLILPINQAISHPLNQFFSEDIIPIILGVSRDASAVSDEEIAYLKQHEPIGCRDEETYKCLISKGVDAYLNGCITMTLETRETEPSEKRVYVIEAPEYAIECMPAELKEKACFLENVCYMSYQDLPEGKSMEDVVRERYKELKEHASLVVTSRMHIASPCIGMGIPVVLVRTTIDYRFSWIDKFVNVYTEDTKNSIDWTGAYKEKPEKIKKLMTDIAKNRIEGLSIDRQKTEQLTRMLSDRNKSNYEVAHFSDGALSYVQEKWANDKQVRYAIWGANDAAERLYAYLSLHYPNAKFVALYDSYKDFSFHGLQSKRPHNIKADDTFIFVTGYTATDAARELFDKINKPKDSYFLYDLVVRNY